MFCIVGSVEGGATVWMCCGRKVWTASHDGEHEQHLDIQPLAALSRCGPPFIAPAAVFACIAHLCKLLFCFFYLYLLLEDPHHLKKMGSIDFISRFAN